MKLEVATIGPHFECLKCNALEGRRSDLILLIFDFLVLGFSLVAGKADGSEGVKRGEIEEEEDSGPIFPLTRRGQKSNTQITAALTEVGNQSPMEMEDERENDLWAQDDTASLRGMDGYALGRIQEEEDDDDDDGEDTFSPHRKRMSLQQARDTDNGKSIEAHITNCQRVVDC